MTIHGVYLDPGTGDTYGQYETAMFINDGLSMADSAVGTWSFWFRSIDRVTLNSFIDIFTGYNATAPDGSSVTVPSGSLVFYAFMNNNQGWPNNGGPVQIEFRDNFTSPTAEFVPYTGPVELDDGRWHHILLTWDTNHAGTFRIFNAAIDRYNVITWVLSPPSTNDYGAAFATPYSTVAGWTINDVDDQGQGCDIAEFWFAPGVSLDVTDVTVINKFVDTSGNPVDLGANGETPTGTAPPLYLSYQSATPADFCTNLGTGGGTFTVYPGCQYPLQQSTSDPSIELPIRVVTQSGTTTDVTLRGTSFAIDLIGDFTTSNFVFLYDVAVPMLTNYTGGPVIILEDPQFDGSNVPSSASFVQLNDDGTTYTRAAIDPPVAGTNLSWQGAADASNIYLSVIGTALQMSVMPIVFGTTVTDTTFTPSGWMTTELGLANPSQNAALLYWNSAIQCIGLFDTAIAGGNAAMIDSAGNPTDAKVWGGYQTNSDANHAQYEDTAILSIPDPGGNQNYLLSYPVAEYNGIASQFMIADNTGTESVHVSLHGDNSFAEAIINGYFADNPSVFPSPIVANSYGYHFLGQTVTDNYLITLSPDATIYTISHLLFADDDAQAGMFRQGATFEIADVSATHMWLYGRTTTFIDQPAYADPLQTNAGFTKLFGVDAGGVGVGVGWGLLSSGTTQYQVTPAPLDPDYFFSSSIGAATEGGTPLPVPDGNSLYVILRADGSGNGYKTQIAWTGGSWILTLEVMPSLSLTTIDMGDGSEFSLFNLYITVQADIINVGVLSFSTLSFTGYYLAPDGTFSVTFPNVYPGPGSNTPFPAAIMITDSTYSAIGNILVGGTAP